MQFATQGKQSPWLPGELRKPTELEAHSQSALTDFLASHNISAQQISSDHQRRVREAEEQAQNAEDHNEDKENEPADDDEDPVERKKRKRKEEMALMKIKQSKEYKRRRFEQNRKNGASPDEDEDSLARKMLAKAQPLPGQLENCENCEKRFTVTPYSKTGPAGGLLCTKCSKELKDEEKKNQALSRKKSAPKGRRRQTESDRMMGDVKPGSKSLVESCVRKVADVVHDIEEFGDMPQNLLDRLSQILSKKRVVTPRILSLFLRPEMESVAIYDCGKLDEDDFQKIFAFSPRVKKVDLRFAGQMKDKALLYMIEKCHDLQHLQLGATNLITNEAWAQLFKKRGHQLESLKLSELNDSLNDQTFAVLTSHCRNLKRLKLRSCSHLTEVSIYALNKLTKLEHLTLAVAQTEASIEPLIDLLAWAGRKLKTLCLEGFTDVNNKLILAIANNCNTLTKLRVTGSVVCTDYIFADLFSKWTNPPISRLDFSECRDIDNANPDGPQDDPVGLGSNALKALMAHSGEGLEKLDLHSCRHISHEALIEVFDGIKQYPLLKDIDFSFVTKVDDVVMRGIFKSCPALTKLAVFACFNARGAKIPAGIAVIGLPNAQDNVVIEGTVTGDF